MSTDPTQPNPTPGPSPDPLIIPTCATCGHTAARCPECGGRDGYNDGSIVLPFCYWCRKFRPGVGYVEPDSIVGWVSGPDGIYEVATRGDQPIPTIPRESTPERRPIERALYSVAQTLADALQAKNWRQAEAALEEWHMFRADLERHVDGDERDRRELVAWVAEMSKGEPRIEFEAEFSARLVDVIDRLVVYGIAEKDGLDLWAMKSPSEKSDWVRKLADKCARAARVTGWREGGSS